jgi:serine/threonine protein kinase
MDPEYLATRKITPQSDIYSFGIVVLRLLTGKPPAGIRKIVEDAVKQSDLKSVVDTLAGEWPEGHIHQLAYLALTCTEQSSMSRPALSGQLWTAVEIMRDSEMSSSPPSSSSVRVESSIPSHFICAISQVSRKELYDSSLFRSTSIDDNVG